MKVKVIKLNKLVRWRFKNKILVDRIQKYLKMKGQSVRKCRKQLIDLEIKIQMMKLVRLIYQLFNQKKVH